MNEIYFINHEKSIEFIYIKGVKNIYNNMQIHSFCELYFFMGGKAEFKNKYQSKKLYPNQLVIIPPGVYHNFNVLSEKHNYERCVLNIYHNFIDEAFLKESLKNKEILTLSFSDRIVKDFLYLIECYNNYSADDFSEILSLTVKDIIYNIKNRENIKNNSTRPVKSLSGELIDYIDKNLNNELVIADIANKFNYSSSHISHIFKENFGISIKNYIIQKRLSIAYNEIQKGRRAMEVSRELGFSNYSTFFRLYKKAYGISPSHKD